jgi:hypothetical protein
MLAMKKSRSNLKKGEKHKAKCKTCKWEGPERDTEVKAYKDANEHLETPGNEDHDVEVVSY